MLDKSRLEELINAAIEWATNVSEQTTEDMINTIGISMEELRELGWNEDSLKILESPAEMESNTFEDAQAKLDEWAHKSKCERKRSNKLWQVPVIWKVYGFNYILAPTFEEAAAIAESPLTPLPIQAELIDSTFSVDYEGRDIYNNENGALSALGAMLGEPVYADNAPTEKALYPIFFLEGESREKALRNTKEAKFDGENVTEDDLISYIKLSGAIFDAEGEFLAYRPDIYEEFFSEA